MALAMALSAALRLYSLSLALRLSISYYLIFELLYLCCELCLDNRGVPRCRHRLFIFSAGSKVDRWWLHLDYLGCTEQRLSRKCIVDHLFSCSIRLWKLQVNSKTIPWRVRGPLLLRFKFLVVWLWTCFKSIYSNNRLRNETSAIICKTTINSIG